MRSKLCLTIFLTFTVCLSKFVCVCFCMQDFFLCVSTSVCMHVLLYEFVQKYSMYGCMHACTYAYMYICISLSTYLCVCGYCLSVSIRVYLSFHLPPPPSEIPHLQMANQPISAIPSRYLLACTPLQDDRRSVLVEINQPVASTILEAFFVVFVDTNASHIGIFLFKD